MHRTGTKSFDKAGRILGFTPSFHWGGKQLGNKLCELYDGCDIEGLLKFADNYKCLSDVPFFLIYRELYNRYPNAYFVMTTRDEDTWFDSLYRHGKNKISKAQKIIYGKWEILEKDKELCKSVFREHNQNVQEFFRDCDNFTVIDIEKDDQWEKLCNLLNIDKPNIGFPKKG